MVTLDRSYLLGLLVLRNYSVMQARVWGSRAGTELDARLLVISWLVAARVAVKLEEPTVGAQLVLGLASQVKHL